MAVDFGKVRKLKQEMDQKTAAGNANFFVLKDADETAVIRFNCREDEPVMTKGHYNARTRQTIRCRQDVDGHCVPCFYKERGHKELSHPQDRAVFNLIDCRNIHKEQSKTETRNDGKPKTTYTPCSEDATCRACRRKVPLERGGQKYWEVALTHAAGVDACNRQLSKRCVSCGGVGKLKIVEYRCGNSECQELMDYTPDPQAEGEESVRCGACKESNPPSEVIECSQGCEEPVRASILDTSIEVTRTGVEKQTAYTFAPVIPFVPMEDWMIQLKPYELVKVCAPFSAETQSKILQLTNPWGRRNGPSDEGSEEYGEEEEKTVSLEEDEELFAEDQEEVLEKTPSPRKVAKVAPNERVASPVRRAVTQTITTRNSVPPRVASIQPARQKVVLKRPMKSSSVPF